MHIACTHTCSQRHVHTLERTQTTSCLSAVDPDTKVNILHCVCMNNDALEGPARQYDVSGSLLEAQKDLACA